MNHLKDMTVNDLVRLIIVIVLIGGIVVLPAFDRDIPVELLGVFTTASSYYFGLVSGNKGDNNEPN